MINISDSQSSLWRLEQVIYGRHIRCITYLMQSLGHFKGPHSVHVCSDDGDPTVAALGVPESEASHEVHLENAKTVRH